MAPEQQSAREDTRCELAFFSAHEYARGSDDTAEPGRLRCHRTF